MALDYKLIGERLRKARLEKGYTQEKLAEIMNVSVAYLSRIETGTTHINLKRLNELSNILGVSEALILNGASENSKSYLNDELSSILRDCSPQDKELIYHIANVIIKKDKK